MPTLNLTQEIPFGFDTEHICAATLSKENEVVMLLNNQTVYRFSLENIKFDPIFSVDSQFTFTDGGYDLEDSSTIYTMDEIVVVANDFKTHAIVHHPGKYNSLRIQRKDYCADISKFPIGLYKDESGVPHLIFAEDWNHVQIMNLDTRQVLTAAKSLIEEGAEEKHLEFYAKHQEDNKLMWPRSFDYFYANLKVSPDSRYFLSAGWHWGSRDYYLAFDIKQFITSNRINFIRVDGGEHEDRAACWVDNTSMVMVFNPSKDDLEDDGFGDRAMDHLCFYRISEDHAEIINKVPVKKLDILHAEIQFDPKRKIFIAHSKKIGVALIDLDGEIRFHDPELKINSYFSQWDLALTVEKNKIKVYQLSD